MLGHGQCIRMMPHLQLGCRVHHLWTLNPGQRSWCNRQSGLPVSTGLPLMVTRFPVVGLRLSTRPSTAQRTSPTYSVGQLYGVPSMHFLMKVLIFTQVSRAKEMINHVPCQCFRLCSALHHCLVCALSVRRRGHQPLLLQNLPVMSCATWRPLCPCLTHLDGI